MKEASVVEASYLYGVLYVFIVQQIVNYKFIAGIMICIFVILVEIFEMII